MPFGDGTGPLGQGSMTGRAAGYCAGYDTPGYANPSFAKRYFGRGGGRGWRNWYRATGLFGWQRAAMGLPARGGYSYSIDYSSQPAQIDQKQEKEFLNQELENLKAEVETVEKRLKELKGSKK